MFPSTRLTELLGVKKPIIAGGMVWCSGHELAAAVSNCGGLGVIGAGSMYPENLQHHIRRCKEQTKEPFGVNIPLLAPEVEKLFEVVIAEKVPVVITSAGNPKTWTARLHEAGCKVLHVVSSAKFAQKAEEAGVDAVIAEGFEAGGHNGREESSTLVLAQSVVEAVSCPVVLAGGFATGRSILAALALGAEGVQIGTLFALTKESSAHDKFKEACLQAGEGSTMLLLKKVVPTRLLFNSFATEVQGMEDRGATKEELEEYLGKRRAKQGIFEGNLEEGELEIGQVVALINREATVEEQFKMLEEDFEKAVQRLHK